MKLAERRETALGKPQPTREEEADWALRNTTFAPGMAWTLCLAFLSTIAAGPILQHVVEIRRNLATRRAVASSGAAPGRLLPQSYDVLALLPTLEEIRSVRGASDALELLPPVAEIRDYETALENQSVLTEWVLPRAQAVLTGRLGVGNEQAYRGRDGWLIYRPDVDYLTSSGFLEPERLRRRQQEAGEGSAPIQPDPVRAITHFGRQLAARGIRLVVMPTPVKPMLHPEKLSARYSGARSPLQNRSFAEFRQRLEQEGVSVFDATGTLYAAKRETGQAQYLETDTHWTPEAMERSAHALAAFIRTRAELPARPPVAYRRRPVAVRQLGDIATMLKLPPGQRLYPPQRVQVQQVLTSSGELWQPQPDAEILLLGDSFSNIYSLSGLGWGESAGFAEQLSFALRRPLDCILVNAGGSYSTRQRLRQQLARGRDRLAGKRLVIWQFAMRDLLIGDWKIIDLPAAPPRKGG